MYFKKPFSLLTTALALFFILFMPHIHSIMSLDSSIYVAGHTGLVGSAIVRSLKKNGYSRIITRTKTELDLRNQAAVNKFFEQEHPEYVFLAAAKVGGIKANATYPAEFIYDNIDINSNVLHAAYIFGVKKLLFLGSSCIYPRNCPQPIKEEYLLTSELEKTNEAYAIAKISGLKMCQAYNKQYGTDFIAVMPTNLYGPGDNFDLETSHVLPALIKKIYDAHTHGDDRVTLWGTGKAYREFLYVDDLASACLFLMNHYDGNELINIGTGKDIMIKDLAEMIKETVGYQGTFLYDTTKPDGTPRKLLNINRLKNLGWQPIYSLKEGIKKTISWYKKHYSTAYARQ